ncbi:MAG: hypothetical protein WCL53_05705, partial [Chloroflexota bacterium]
MNDGIGLAEALLGLDGLRVLAVVETSDELVIRIETTATAAWCATVGCAPIGGEPPGRGARPAVCQVAGEFGVCWRTVTNAVTEHGTPLVDDPDRVGAVRMLGVDETSFLKANRHHST